MHPLIDAFRAGLPTTVAAVFVPVPDLVERLEQACARAAAAWPTIALDPRVFAGHLATKTEAGGTWSSDLRVEDLWLACALGRGDAAALRILEREYFPQIAAVLARRGVGADGADEVAQNLREHLLVGTATRPARIRDYAGRGSLRAWIIVAAARMGSRAAQRTRRSAAAPLISVADPRGAAAASELVDDRHRGQLEHACEQALLELPQRERALLRLQLVDGASIDQIGRIYGVHRATAARWLASARAQVLACTRRRLAAALGVDAEAAASIAQRLHSHLDVSVARLLQTSPS